MAAATADRIGDLLAGDKAQRAAAYDELSIMVTSGDESDAVATATAVIVPLLDLLSAPASRVDREETQRVNLLMGSLMLLNPLEVGMPWLQDARWLAQWSREDTAVAAMASKEAEQLTRDDVLLAAYDTLPIMTLWAKGWTQCCEAAGVDEMAGYGGWLSVNPFSAGNTRSPKPNAWNERCALLAIEICRHPQGLSDLESAAVWALFVSVMGQRPQVAAAAVDAGLLEVVMATLSTVSPADWTSWRTPAGLRAGMAASTVFQMVAGVPGGQIQRQIDSGFPNAVVSMLQVRAALA